MSTTAPDPKRLELQTLLEGLLGEADPNVYFQQPPSTGMRYPCIVYAQDNAKTEFAGNFPYSYVKRYMVTHISRDPDSPVPDKIARLQYANFDRAYTADNLHHKVFNLYF